MFGDASVLDPLLARYGSWLALPDSATRDTADEDPDNVILMPMVLRIERQEPPGRTALLEAAAIAAIEATLDERCLPGGPWHEPMHDWISGRIRKVTRRARGAHWRAVQELPGHTTTVGDAEVRALLPCRVSEMPRAVSRLQISGSDLPFDEPGPAPADVPVLWLNPEVPMSAGKLAAQVGHGTMIVAALLRGQGRDAEVAEWAAHGYPCAVRVAEVQRWKRLHPGDDPAGAWRQRGVAAVRDAGFTEVDPGTVTVLAQWPSSG